MDNPKIHTPKFPLYEKIKIHSKKTIQHIFLTMQWNGGKSKTEKKKIKAMFCKKNSIFFLLSDQPTL